VIAMAASDHRASRGDEVAVDDDFGVLPLGSRVAQVVGDRLVLLVQVTHQAQDTVVRSQLVGPVAAGDHDQVEVVGVQVVGVQVVGPPGGVLRSP